jgi:hypothetical protein
LVKVTADHAADRKRLGGIADPADIGQRDQDADAGRGHQPAPRVVLGGARRRLNLRADRLPGPEQGRGDLVQGTLGDQALSAKVLPIPLPVSRPNGLSTPRIWLPRSTRGATNWARAVIRVRQRETARAA